MTIMRRNDSAKLWQVERELVVETKAKQFSVPQVTMIGQPLPQYNA